MAQPQINPATNPQFAYAPPTPAQAGAYGRVVGFYPGGQVPTRGAITQALVTQQQAANRLSC